MNPANRHLFYSDDQRKKDYEIDPGPDRIYHTSDDIRTFFSTSAFGSTDPEDVTYHPGEGVIYLVDGVNREVYRIAPGPNGIFNGIPPAGDDVLTHFDVSAIVTDPEGLTVNTDSGNLYIAGKPDTIVQEITTSGALVQTIDISAANAQEDRRARLRAGQRRLPPPGVCTSSREASTTTAIRTRTTASSGR